MNNLIKELSESISKTGLLLHQEEYFYYIMSENNTDVFILLQLKGTNLIVWSYDNNICSLNELIKKIEHLFCGTIVFPHVEDKRDISILLQNNYHEIEYKDANVEAEQKIYPSFEKEASL